MQRETSSQQKLNPIREKRGTTSLQMNTQATSPRRVCCRGGRISANPPTGRRSGAAAPRRAPFLATLFLFYYFFFELFGSLLRFKLYI